MKKYLFVSAAVFVWLAASWTLAAPGDLLQTFANPTPEKEDYFGCSVAALGNNVLVGAMYVDPEDVFSAGEAYLFDGDTGELLQTFFNPSPEAFDNFGYSITPVDSDKALVGVPRHGAGEDGGAAYLFDAQTGSLLRTFLNPYPEPGDGFGYSVAGLDNKVLVGSPGATAGGQSTGEVYLFDSQTGALLQTFLNPTPQTMEQFGQSVAVVGDKVLVGDPSDRTGVVIHGAAYLFDVNSGELLRTFVNPTPEDLDSFGYSLSAVGDNKIVVGDPHDDTVAEDAGATYLFDTETGDLLETFFSPYSVPDHEYFGLSVAALGSYHIVIGVDPPDAISLNPGAAYLFDIATGELVHAFLSPNRTIAEGFGHSVGALGNNVLVGATRASPPGSSGNYGAIYLFEGIFLGDVNLDGFVGADDLVAILDSWGQTGATWEQGDLTGDGFVGADDYVEVLSHWGDGSLPPQPIPEPATLAFLLLLASTSIVLKHK